LLDLAAGEDWTLGELHDALAAVRHWAPESGGSEPLPPWLHGLFTAVAGVRKCDVAVHPSGGLVLRAPASAPRDDEPDLFADEDDQLSQAPEEIHLADHTAQVERTAGLMARACLDDATASVIQAAARWHDAGKLDPRFQALLRGGLPDPGRPLAKSPDLRRAREQAQRNREAAGLPDDFRHEMLSLQLACRFAAHGFSPADHELFLHLIASHHGHARPFAPVCEDREPPPVTGQCSGIEVNLSTDERQSLTPAHRLDSGVSDRFWRLVRRFGWWSLAYREAILRLADWLASANPRKPQP
jgi:CRISPR-associated endonuclease/helicase Cas3